ncbi:related to cytochrome-c oxidase assembly protein (COX11) [Cephalotrichum gorgonifer]|uniref:Related to cytochrome-c oxidase assembly protein (COX11) n=1 Tax=Cephalotrichum gorgonifer TaxID=2041049 RepID=A0AAE8N461_9PEZI|nr:related to cytochrome-c oxidase assembly protein (COX11) [Cephalotrichum gorgonifer]
MPGRWTKVIASQVAQALVDPAGVGVDDQEPGWFELPLTRPGVTSPFLLWRLQKPQQALGCFERQSPLIQSRQWARSCRRSASGAASGGNPTARPTQEQTMEKLRAHYKEKNKTAAFYVLSVILATAGLSYGSVPLYKMICQKIGWGGQPIRVNSPDSNPDIADRLHPVTTAPRIRVTFNSSVSDVLPWKFTPQQKEVSVHPGETALAFYTATNTSDQDIIGVATYSVTPAQVAPYFSKIQCFCFEEQRLAAGETVDMPVFFYLDPDLLDDFNMRNVKTVTLNYTFFKARYDDNGKFKAPAVA